MSINDNEEKIKDHWHLVKIIFIVQGCACLLPLNVYMNNPDYFINLYGSSIMTIFSATFLIPNLFGLLYMNIIGYRVLFLINVLIPYLYYIISLLGIPIIVFFNLKDPWNLIITICILVGSGWFTAILEGEVFGKSYVLPNGTMTRMIMFGIGIIGILISSLKVITKFISDNIMYYFFISSGFMGLSLILILMLYCLPYSLTYLKFCEKRTIKKIEYFEILESLLLIKGDCWNIFLIFLTSMSIFPGISSILPTSYPGTFMREWYSIIMATLFTLFDFVGRTIPNFYIFKNRDWIRRIIILRLNFIVGFFLYIHPIFFIHIDIIPILMMIIMALTNGYFSTIVMERVNIDIKDQLKDQLKENTGNLMAFFMLLGIASGSVLSIIILYINNLLYKLIIN